MVPPGGSSEPLVLDLEQVILYFGPRTDTGLLSGSHGDSRGRHSAMVQLQRLYNERKLMSR